MFFDLTYFVPIVAFGRQLVDELLDSSGSQVLAQWSDHSTAHIRSSHRRWPNRWFILKISNTISLLPFLNIRLIYSPILLIQRHQLAKWPPQQKHRHLNFINFLLEKQWICWTLDIDNEWWKKLVEESLPALFWTSLTLSIVVKVV